MPTLCSVYNCGQRSMKGKVSLHKFPFHDEARLQKWIAFANRGPTWVPAKSATMCSLHFVNPVFDSGRILNDPVRRLNPDRQKPVAVSKILSFNNLKIILPSPSSQSGISVKGDGIYFGTSTTASTTSIVDNSNNLKEAQIIDVDTPPIKKTKLENCIICKNVARDLEEIVKDKYSKILIRNVHPDAEKRNKSLKNCKAYNFCVPCTNVLEELKKLNENLKTVQKSIEDKIEKIKLCISKSKTEEGKELLEGKIFQMMVASSEPDLPSEDEIELNSHLLSCGEDTQVCTSEKLSCQDPLEDSWCDYPEAEIKSEMGEELNPDNGDEEQPVPFEPWKRCHSSSNKEKDFRNDLDNYDKDCLMYVDPKVKENWPQPPLDFIQLSILAIVSSKSRRMSVSDIYNFIGNCFPFFKTDSKANVCRQVKRAVSTSGVFQLIDYEPHSHFPIKQKRYNNYIPFWTVVEKDLDEYRNKLIQILGSRELGHSLAFPENVQAFTDSISEETTQANAMSSPSITWTHWRPPPFSYPQIIFFALASHPCSVYTSQVIKYFKDTFPYFVLLKDWDYGVFFNLQSEYFTEIIISESNPRRLSYCINTNNAKEMKKSILETVNDLDLINSPQQAKHFMRNPGNLKDMLNSIEEYSVPSENNYTIYTTKE